jgi:hypothetical protein
MELAVTLTVFNSLTGGPASVGPFVSLLLHQHLFYKPSNNKVQFLLAFFAEIDQFHDTNGGIIVIRVFPFCCSLAAHV